MSRGDALFAEVLEWDWYRLTDPYEQEMAWRAAKADPLVFLTKAWTIKVPDGPPRLMNPWGPQREIVEHYKTVPEQTVSLKARQIGWTTVTTAFSAHSAMFHEYRPWLYVSRTEKAAIKNLGMTAFGFRRMPKWMRERAEFDSWRITSDVIELGKDGSFIESVPATPGAGRGDAVYGVMMDEAAYPEAAAEIFAALEPLCYGMFVVLSTANGQGNWFHETWLDSEKPGSEWTGLFYSWRARADRDDKWYEKQKRKFRGSPWMLYQEYPNNPVEAFARSGRVAIDYDLLNEFDYTLPYHRFRWNGEAFDLHSPMHPHDSDEPLFVDVFEPPTIERDPEFGFAVRAPNYVIFVDPAEGLIDGDYTAIVVYNANTGACVARVQTHYQLEGIPEVVEWLGYWYHTALVGVERNNHGHAVINALQRYLGYPRMYAMEQLSKRRRSRSQTLGWQTTPASKAKMVRDYMADMRKHRVDPRDPLFRSEATTFIIDETGKYGASPGNHDDVIIAHMGAGQLMRDVGRFPIIWYDEVVHVTTMDDIDAIAAKLEYGADDQPVRIGGSVQEVATKPSFYVHPERIGRPGP